MNVYVQLIQQLKKILDYVMLVCISLITKEEYSKNNNFIFLKAIVAERENVLQCQCLHGKCVYHVDEKSGQRLMGCVCFFGKYDKYFK
jgi:hypothetical protein